MYNRQKKNGCHWQALCWWFLASCLPAQSEGAEIPRLCIIGRSAGLSSSNIVGLGQDCAGHMMDGLYQIAADGTLQAWWHDSDEPDSLPEQVVISLTVDTDGTLWVATTRGLARFDTNTQGFAVIDPGGVRVDAQHRLWLSTPRLNRRPIALHHDGQRHSQWPIPKAGTALTLAHAEHEFQVSMRLPTDGIPTSSRYWSQQEGYDLDGVAQGNRVFNGIPAQHYTLRLRTNDANSNPSDIQTLDMHVQPLACYF